MSYDVHNRTESKRRSAHCGRCFLAIILWFFCSHAVAEEQLEQEPIVIKGNQGLPGTIFIAPWKRTGSPLPNEKLEGEIGEETEPLERDLFQRELELQREGYGVEPPAAPQAAPGSTVDS